MLLGALTPTWASFFVSTTLVGLGVGIVVGGTLRTMVLDEVDAARRSAAQALVNPSSPSAIYWLWRP